MTCCVLMSRALAASHRREIRGAGLHTQQLYNTQTGQCTPPLLLYRIAGSGKGKERKEPETCIVKWCPFCGKETGVLAELERHGLESKPSDPRLG